MKWISMKKNLPEINQKIELAHPLFGFFSGHFTRTDTFAGNRFPRLYLENTNEFRTLDLLDKDCYWYWRKIE